MKFNPNKKISARVALDKKKLKGETSLGGKDALINIADRGIEGSETLGFTIDIFNKIDFDAREFIDRKANVEEMLEDPKIEALAKSINDISLINPIYIKTHGTGYKIVSGYRRCCAIKYGLDNIEGFKVVGVLIKLPSETDNLEILQINENLHRVKLSDIELGYKIESYARNNNISNNETFKKYNLTESVGKRAVGSLKYPLELKNIIRKIGPSKSAELNKLIKVLGDEMSIQDILEKYKDLTRDEIKMAIKNAKKDHTEEYFTYNICKNSFKIEIQESVTIEDINEIKKFIIDYFKSKR